MKQGMTLDTYAREIARQQEAKRDFLANTKVIDIAVENTTVSNLDAIIAATEDRLATNKIAPADIRLRLGDMGDFSIKPLAHQQIAQYCGIPKPYYDRMLTAAPELLVANLKTWFAIKGDRRMIRTLDGFVRALLSDRYRPLDNFDLVNAVLPTLVEKEAAIVSCNVSDSQMYLKAVQPKVQFKVKTGDAIQAGIVIKNSEVGQGRLSVLPYTVVLACENGAVHTRFGAKRTHVGSRNIGGDEIPEEWLSTETKKKDDEALWMKVRDVVRGTLDETKIQPIIESLNASVDRKIEADPIKVVEKVRTSYGISETDGKTILEHLVDGGSLTQWGLGNAITRASQQVDDYDTATMMEQVGGSILEMQPQEWDSLNSVN